MTDANQVRSYFSAFDGFMQERGIGSMAELHKRVQHLQSSGEFSIPAIGVFEVFVVCLVTIVFTLPTLAVWIVLIVSGGGLVALRILYSQLMRRRWAGLLAEWEADHPLAPLAREAVEHDAEPTRQLVWMVSRQPRTRLDWCLNYLAAMVETRRVLLSAGERAHGGPAVEPPGALHAS